MSVNYSAQIPSCILATLLITRYICSLAKTNILTLLNKIRMFTYAFVEKLFDVNVGVVVVIVFCFCGLKARDKLYHSHRLSFNYLQGVYRARDTIRFVMQ